MYIPTIPNRRRGLSIARYKFIKFFLKAVFPDPHIQVSKIQIHVYEVCIYPAKNICIQLFVLSSIILQLRRDDTGERVKLALAIVFESDVFVK